MSYTLSWKKGFTIKVGEWTIPSPDPPAKKDMLNYGLPDKDQYFVHQRLSDEELSRMDPKAAHERVMQEFHRFENGEWVLINGRALWFPPSYWFTINYWQNTEKQPMDFRYGLLQVAWLWDYACRHPFVYGILGFKLRRFGFTEMALADQYFTAFRIRGSICGSMHVTDDEAQDDLDRLVAVHGHIPQWLRPKTTSDKIGQSALKMFHVKESDEDPDPIGSFVLTGPTKNGTFDGKKMRRVGIREFGKWDLTRANPIIQLGILRPCCMSTIGKPLIGKIIYETTVEKVKGGENIAKCKELWDSSGPDSLKENGVPDSGLLRLFIDTPNFGAVDKYGMPDVEAAKKFLKEMEKALERKPSELIAERRKFPTTIDDVFQLAEEHAFFSDQISVNKRYTQVLNGQDYLYRKSNIIPRRGKLVWKGGLMDTLVEWVDDENGAWEISAKPDEENKDVWVNGKRAPNAKSKYAMGVDPYNSMITGSRISKGAAVVMAKFDMIRDHMGNVPAGEMVSNRIICDYIYRHEKPDDFYEDMIKTAVYFGCEVLYENVRDGLGEHFINRGYERYLMFRPEQLRPNRKSNTLEIGAPSNTKVISSYTEKLLSYYVDYTDAIYHIRILSQMRTFTNTQKGRGSHDLIVAWGYALEAMEKNAKDQEELDQADNEEWFRTYTLST
jgi:hypothetical protein